MSNRFTASIRERRAARHPRLGPVAVACVLAWLPTLAGADRVQTLDQGELFGTFTLNPGQTSATVEPEEGQDGEAVSIDLEGIDEVLFGEDQAVSDGGVLLINNDTQPWGREQSEKIKLRAGLHRFVIPYWQADGQSMIRVSVAGPTIPGPTPLGDGNIVCYRRADGQAPQSPGIDREGFRLPELALKEADNRRQMQSRCRYRLHVGDANSPFENVGVLSVIPMKHSGTTTSITTAIVNDPQEYFGLVFEGFFVAPEDGEYTFTLASNEGSQFYFGRPARFKADALGTTPIDAPWRIKLRHGGLIRGQLKAIADDTLRVHVPLVSDVELSLSQATELWDARTEPSAIDSDPPQPGTDTAYIRDKEDPDKLVAISGKALSLDDEALTFDFRGQARSINRDRIAGLVLDHADRPAPADPGFYQVLRLRGGQVLPSKVLSIGERAEFELLGGGRVAPPRDVLISMRGQNGRRADLTRIKPTAEEAIPYFGLELAHRVNRSFDDQPIKLFDGKTYERGLAVHSKSRLHYKLDRPAERFTARFGLMDPGGRLGEVAVRVLGDGEVLWQQVHVTAASEVIEVDVPLDGVKRLVLEVDFGQGQGVGDRAAWCDPQVIYAASE